MDFVNSYVERLLDRISNGVLAEDRRNAIIELQSVVAETRAAQLAFGAMGTLSVKMSRSYMTYIECFFHKMAYPLLLQAFLYS